MSATHWNAVLSTPLATPVVLAPARQRKGHPVLRKGLRAAAWNLALFFGPLGIYWLSRNVMLYGALRGWWPLPLFI